MKFKKGIEKVDIQKVEVEVVKPFPKKIVLEVSPEEFAILATAIGWTSGKEVYQNFNATYKTGSQKTRVELPGVTSTQHLVRDMYEKLRPELLGL